MQGIDGIFYLLILIASVVIHEVAHGLAADHYGDPTARMQGRLSLNPIRHLDWFGSVLLPLMLILSGTGIVVGWAKPVPYNPNNFRNKKVGIPMVAVAGIIANLSLALIFGLLIRFGIANDIGNIGLYQISSTIVLVNLVLALFNAIPIPPLDGFRLIFSLLPARFASLERDIERYGIMLLIIFLFVGWKFVAPIVFWLYSAITGLAV